MDRIIITPDSKADDFLGIAMCVHSLFGNLPITARSKNHAGLQIENGTIKSKNYTGPVLERVIKEGVTIKMIPDSGTYKGVPVIVSPLKANNVTIAAIGVVDVTGSLEIKSMMDQYMSLQKQMGNR